jgi:hypothetical protein
MYFAYAKTDFCQSNEQLADFANQLDTAQEGAWLPDGKTLYPPYVIVCHDTRYKKNSLTGLIRVLGIGKFGEFSTFTFEVINKQLTSELKRKKIEFDSEHIFAEYGEIRALGVLRTYSQTNPGRRSLKYRLDVLSPEKDLGLDVQAIAERAKARYRIDDA